MKLQVKTRRNLRTSGRLSKATEVDAAPDAVEQDAACYYDDIFARPRWGLVKQHTDLYSLQLQGC